MKVIKSKFCRNINNLAFFILFPGFFFYHSAIGMNLFPAFLGALLGIVLVVFTPLTSASFYYLKGRYKSSYSSIDLIFLFLMLLNVITTFANYVLSRPHGFVDIIFMQSMSGILGIILCYALARTISIDSSKFVFCVFVLLVIMDLIVMYNIGDRGIFYVKLESENSDSVATYQGFARSMLVVGLFAIVLVKNKAFNLALFFLTIPALFLNGARTEFIVFLITISALILRRSKFSGAIGSLVLILIVSLFLTADYIISILPPSRMLDVFDVFSSNSGESRINLLKSAISTIKDYPILGDYGSYVEISSGSYAHNILSAWVNLGLLGFLLYLAVMLISMYHATRVFFTLKLRDTLSTLMFVFVVSTVISLLFSKMYGFMLFGFMVGLTSRFIEKQRNDNQSFILKTLAIDNKGIGKQYVYLSHK